MGTRRDRRDSRGQQRLAALPPLIGDDLAASPSFAPHERAIVADARVVVHIPRKVTDLLRVQDPYGPPALAQMERTEHAPESTARTSKSDLAAIIRNEPRMAPRVALFVFMAATRPAESAPRGGERRLFDVAA